MITKVRITAAAVVAVALTIGILAFGVDATATHPRVNLDPVATKALMDERTPGWLTWNELGADGLPVKTFTQYRNGDFGTLFWRLDHTQDHEVIVDQQDRPVMQAVYSDDGKQIVSGFRLRADLTKVWEATPDAHKLVTTTTYWYDGSRVFLVQERHINSPRIDEMYYHTNGVKWMHYFGTADRDVAPGVAEIWNEGGFMVFSHYTGLNGTSQDSGYHDDGKLAWRQSWLTQAHGGYGSAPRIELVLLKAEQYDSGGDLSREYIMSTDGYVLQRVVDHAPGGLRSELILNNLGTVAAVFSLDADGRPTQQTVSRRDSPRVELTAFLRANHVADFDPRVIWQRLEDNPKART